ncbi:MAG: hypothetical protein IJY93_10415 [Clostridia bacterium]|nr:hypothetical protein [Clostridia bacterium]
MKKSKFAAILLAVLMLTQTFWVNVDAASAVLSIIPSIDEDLPKGNLLKFSRFNAANCLVYWECSGATLSYDDDENGGYIRVSNISASHNGPVYTPGETIEAGKYLFTGYFRTQRVGQITELRLIFGQKTGEALTAYVYPTNDWLKVEYYIDLTDELTSIKVCGGAPAIMRQDYCFDHFSLVPVDEIPENAPSTFGTPVTPDDVKAVIGSDSVAWAWDPKTEAQYEVNGIAINNDFSGFIGMASRNGITEPEIVQYARQYEGTHLTDMFTSVNDVCSMFPNNVVTSYLDKYYWTEENGEPVDYSEQSQAKGSYYLYKTLAVDPIGVLNEAFSDMGVNHWLSFRMNDVHDMATETTSIIFSEFYHKHPEVRRVQHHSYVGNFDKAMNYTHESVREYMLGFINEALNRYDCYGIELDFQRELWLWHIGGEYNGVEILNDFMRKVDELMSVYEEKYGHEIKLAVTVAYDIETNFDFGLDIITWVTEGLIDWISPSCRFSTTDTDIPVKMWDSLCEAYDVVLAPRIDPSRLSSRYGAANVGMDIETLSATAANYFSQGADKISLFNYYRDSNNFFTSGEKFNSKTPGEATSWSVLCTIGSYEKLMYMNRRCILSWKDMSPLWESTVSYLPKTLHKGGFATFRIPVGDVIDGSDLTLKFSVSTNEAIKNPPVVYINSTPCEYIGLDLCRGAFTDRRLMCYDVPESVYGDTYMVIEIMNQTHDPFEIDHMEVYVEGPEIVLE